MDDQRNTKEQCLEALQKAHAEIARLQKAVADQHSASELRYKAALDVMPEMMFWFDSQGVFIDYKASAQQHLYIPPEVFLGKEYHQVLPPNVTHPMEKAIEAARQTRTDQVFCYELPFDNDIRTFEARISSSSQDFVTAIITDITSKAKTEAALEQEKANLVRSEAQLIEAMDMADMAYWEFDVATGQFIFNDPFYAFLRTSAVQEGGYRMSVEDYTRKYVPEDEAARVGSKTILALTENDPEKIYDEESRMIRADGEEISIHIRLRVVQDEQGRPVKLYGMNQNVTEARKVLNELSRTELMYRQILDSISDMILVKGPKSKIVWGNKAFREMYGMSNEQLRDMIDAPAVEPDLTQKYIQDDEYVFHSGKTLFIAEENVTRFDGEVIPVQTVKSPVFDKDGKVIMTVGVFRDITEAKRASEELERQRRTLQVVLDNMPAGVFMVEAPSGRPILSNKKAEEFLGRGISPKAVESDLNQVYQAYRYGTDEFYPVQDMPVVAGLYGESKTIRDMEVRRPDGSRLLLEVTGAPVYDTDGKLVASVVVFSNITERRKLEDTIIKDRGQLADALKAASMASWEYDIATGMFTFTDDFYKMLGTTAEEEGGYQMHAAVYAQKYVHPDDAAEVGRNVQLALETNDPNFYFESESRMIRKDGELRWSVIRFRIGKDEQSRKTTLFGANQDITERKRAEEIIAKRAAEMATVSQVATSVATIQDPDEMLQTVVDLTKQAFKLYHAHIYQLNDRGDALVLAKGSAEVGRKMAAEGRMIPINAEKSLVARAARLREGVIVNDVRQDPDFLPHPLLPDTRSEMAVPLIVGDQLLGVLDTQSEIVNRFTQEDVLIMMTLSSQVAVALQNARQYMKVQAVLIENRQLFSEAQKRAAQLQKLAEIQDMLSTAQNEEDILSAAARLGVGPDDEIPLFYVDCDDTGNPVRMHAEALWKNGKPVENHPMLGVVYDLSQFAYSQIWIKSPDQPVFISDWRTDPDVDEAARQEMLQSGALANVSIPLHSGGRWVGLISINYAQPHTFTEDERFLMSNLIEPFGATVASRRAYLAEDEALNEAEVLYRATSQLARSHTFDEVLDVMVEYSFLRNFDTASIQFYNIPWKDRTPDLVSFVSVWERSEGLAPFQRGETIPVAQLPEQAEAKYQSFVLSGDLSTDTTMEPQLREYLIQQGWHASLQWRLIINDEWVGTLSAASKRPLIISDKDIRRLNTLVEQASTVIQSLQLLGQIQKALNETANLYMASRRLNEADNLQAMVAAVAEGLRVPDINRAVLVLTEYDEQGEIQGFSVAANWYSGVGTPVTPVGVRFSREMYKVMPMMLSPNPLFLNDLQNDPRMDANTRALLNRQKLAAIAVLPLFVGSHQIGALLLQCEVKHEFTEEEIRTYQALVRQLAVTVESRRLYEAAQARARREQTLREITARVRGSMDPDVILRTAVRELGAALGRPTFVRLGSAEELARKPEDGINGSDNGTSPINGEGPSPMNGEGGK